MYDHGDNELAFLGDTRGSYTPKEREVITTPLEMVPLLVLPLWQMMRHSRGFPCTILEQMTDNCDTETRFRSEDGQHAAC